MDNKEQIPPGGAEPLDLETRNNLQLQVLDSLFDDSALEGDKVKWLADNGEMISEIIDNPSSEEIRELALNGQYQEAVELLIKALNDQEYSKAA